MRASEIRIGVIGTGFGAFHAEVFAGMPGARVTAIASARRERAEAVAAKVGAELATDDWRALLGVVDAVVIATPPALHAEQALAAVAAGIHVFCEKPLAASVAEARAMRDAAVAAGVVHMTNFHQRFTSDFGTALAMATGGELGRLLAVDVLATVNPLDYLRLPMWSDSKAGWFANAGQGGGLLASSVGPHFADLLVALAAPVEVLAASTLVSQRELPLPGGGTTGPISAEDGFVVVARGRDGALCTLRGVPAAIPGITYRMELHGDAASLLLEESALRIRRTGEANWSAVPLPEPRANERTTIAGRFLDAIRNGDPAPAPTFDDGLAAQEVLEAALAAGEPHPPAPSPVERGGVQCERCCSDSAERLAKATPPLPAGEGAGG